MAEAEPALRERLRTALGEPYRTPLGHVRHELGHWWWQAAVGTAFTFDEFREMFGDERQDYAAALEQHYGSPDHGAWASTHVSHYAASHPWEDFAETFAHVLHMTDTYETARAHHIVTDDEPHADFAAFYERWVDVTMSLNELTRSMGVRDPYPFIVAPEAVAKFEFVHDVLRNLDVSRSTEASAT